MPRAKRPCVDCQRRVTPRDASCVPRCKKCYERFRSDNAKSQWDKNRHPVKKGNAEELLAELDEKIVYRTKRTMPSARGGVKILMIPDLQIGPGTPTDHLDWIASYIADKRPDVIVQIGDWADMPSLSTYDRGKLIFEGRRLRQDFDAVEASLHRLTNPLGKLKGYNPRRLITGGNHEDRITRAINEDARLEGVFSLDDLRFQAYGWEYHDFLLPVKIEGVEFAHYFTSGPKGLAINNAKRILAERHGSALSGHNQRFDIAVHDKTEHIAIISGACYLHSEEYLGPQQNSQKRQVVMLHEVKDGIFDPMFVSLSYLEKRYR